MAHERNGYPQVPYRETYGPTGWPAWGPERGAYDSSRNRTWGDGQEHSSSKMGWLDPSSRNSPRDAYATTSNRTQGDDRGYGYPKFGSMDYTPRKDPKDAHDTTNNRTWGDDLGYGFSNLGSMVYNPGNDPRDARVGLRDEERSPHQPVGLLSWFPNFVLNFVGLGGHSNTATRDSPSAGGTGPEFSRPSPHDKEPEFRHSTSHSSYAPSMDPQSRNTADGANGYHHGNVGSHVRKFGDDISYKPAVHEARVNETEVIRLRKEIEILKNRVKLRENDFSKVLKDREHFKLELEFQIIKMKKEAEDASQLRQNLLDNTVVLAKKDAALEMKDAECRKLKNDVEQLKRECLESKSLLVVFRRENQEFKSTSQKLIDENHVLKSSLQKLKDEYQELKSSLQKLKDENQELKSSLQERSGENRDLTSTLQELSRENQELKSNIAMQEETRAREADSGGQVDTKLSHVELRTTIDKLEANRKQLTNQVEASSKRIEELKHQMSTLQLKLRTNDMEMQNLRSRLRVELEHLEHRQLLIQKLEQDLKQRNAQFEILEQEAQDLRHINKSLTTAMAANATAISSYGDQEEREFEAEYFSLKAQVDSSESEAKDSTSELMREIDDLKNQIQLLKRDSGSVEFLPPPKEYHGGDSFLETQATPYLLDKAVQRVHDVAGNFARLLTKAMDQGKIDGMAVARNDFVRSQSIGKAAPLKYVLEAITCKLLFQGFENECFELQDSTPGFLDMEEQRMENFRQYKHLCSMDYAEKHVLMGDNLFTKFCRLKLANLSAAIPEVESMVNEIMFRAFEQSTSEDGSTSQVADTLGTTFVKLAMSVWKVHKLAFSFNPVVRIFRVPQSEQFVERFMESVIFQESESDDDGDQSSDYIASVDFMVVPGFLINKVIVRSRVFLVSMPVSNGLRFPSPS